MPLGSQGLMNKCFEICVGRGRVGCGGVDAWGVGVWECGRVECGGVGAWSVGV